MLRKLTKKVLEGLFKKFKVHTFVEKNSEGRTKTWIVVYVEYKGRRYVWRDDVFVGSYEP